MILILNGPPNSGKDAIADYISNYFGWEHKMFKGSLYDLAIRASGVSEKVAMHHFTDRKVKEQESPLFRIGGNPVSPRKYLQHISEEVIKPMFGNDFFGVYLSKQIQNEFTVVSDSGFIEEAARLSKNHLVALVQVHRANCTFDGDTRRYLTQEECEANNIAYFGELNNDGTLEDLYAKAARLVNDCIDY